MISAMTFFSVPTADGEYWLPAKQEVVPDWSSSQNWSKKLLTIDSNIFFWIHEAVDMLKCCTVRIFVELFITSQTDCLTWTDCVIYLHQSHT